MGGCESEFPGSSLLDEGIGSVGDLSSGSNGWGLGERYSSILTILGDDDILEESLDDELGRGITVFGVANTFNQDGDVADWDT